MVTDVEVRVTDEVPVAVDVTVFTPPPPLRVVVEVTTFVTVLVEEPAVPVT